jgi:hypothetical protein
MIGSISTAIAAGSIGSIPPGIMTSELYGYNGAYFVTDSIHAGYGYWIKTSQDGKLILSSSSPAQTNRLHIVRTTDLPPSAPPDHLSNSGSSRPMVFELFQNYPNPFNPGTSIKYVLPKSAWVSLKVFNMLGEKIATLVEGIEDAGYHQVEWDASGQSSGVFYYRLKSDSFVETRKLVLLK